MRIDLASPMTSVKPSVAVTTFTLLPVYATGRAASVAFDPILSHAGVTEYIPAKFITNLFGASLINQVGAPCGRTTPRTNGNGPRKAVAHESYSHAEDADYIVTARAEAHLS